MRSGNGGCEPTLKPRYSPPEGDVLQTSERVKYGCECFQLAHCAAGLGLEPRYSPPEGDVLPLDDPAAQCTNSGTFTHVVPSERSLYGLYTIRRSGKKVPKTPRGAFAIYHIRQCPARYTSDCEGLLCERTRQRRAVPPQHESSFFQFTRLFKRVDHSGTHVYTGRFFV